MDRFCFHLLHLVVVGLLIACGESGNGKTQVRDDGRVRRLAIDSSPSLSIPIGGTNDSSSLTHLIGATQLSDGTLLVMDGYPGHEQALKAFSTTGSFLWSSGRQGGGPGEFRAVTWVGQCGPGSVFTWDGGNARLSVFDDRGKLARDARLPVTPVPLTISCSRSGSLAMMTAPVPSPPVASEFPRLSATLMLVSSTGDGVWSLPNLSLGQNRVLGTITRLALGTDRLYVGTGDSAYVDAYDLSGHLVTSFKVGEPPAAPTRAQYEHAVDQVLNLLPGTQEARRMARNRFLQVPMPERLPPYFGLIVDPARLLWVVTSPPGEAPTEIRAFTAEGELVGTVTLPAAVHVVEIGENHILGIAALGEETALVSYALHRN